MGLEGIAVVANYTSLRGLTVRGNVVRDNKARAIRPARSIWTAGATSDSPLVSVIIPSDDRAGYVAAPHAPSRAAAAVLGTFGLALAVLGGAASPAGGREIGPDANLCVEINRLAPGEELVLRPGEYLGPCTIRRSGRPGAPIIIRAKDPRQKPLIVWRGRSSNVFDIKADYVTIRDLRIGPTQDGVDGVRVFDARGITVQGGEFSGLGGIAVVANPYSVHGLTVRGNVVLRSRATGMYFGCHDGSWCVVTDLLVEGNHIHGVTVARGAVGYGIQVKLNSSGTIRGNVVVDTAGPGIMVYGAQDRAVVSVVERNFVVGSRGSSGIVVGGGPALVRNNIAVANAEAGLLLEDYKNRGLLRSIVLAHNTLFGNARAGIMARANGPVEAVVVNNAVHARPGTLAVPAQRAGLSLLGNVDCSAASCFSDPEQRDFSPAPDSPLASGAAPASEWLPAEDFFRARRGPRPVAGAIEGQNGPIPLRAVKP